MPVLVWDLGGTLMEYTGMPQNWSDYYRIGFYRVRSDFSLPVSEEAITCAVDTLKYFNPRNHYREEEYSPEYIMGEAIRSWETDVSIEKILESFFKGIQLQPFIYEDVFPVFKILKQKKYSFSTLTDLPTAMPDALFQRHITDLLSFFDFYVSSQSCGYRKPNPYGLQLIAEHFHVRVQELTFIGDEEKDYQTACSAGCRFIWVDRRHTVPVCVEFPVIHTLQELREIISYNGQHTVTEPWMTKNIEKV